MSVNHNNTPTNDKSSALQETIKQAYANQTPLNIIGKGTKSFYGLPAQGERFEVAGHCGVVDYEPSELVITARTGTPLTAIETTLAQGGQMLAFEPPHFGEGATLGGTIACGFSGPRRPYSGSARDFVLGIQCINGKGEILKFGGQVMKNVAGYDVSRLMVGALGTLGVLLEVSLKVLPKPVYEITLFWEKTPEEALKLMNTWAAQSLPLSATCYVAGQVYLRLSGTQAGVKAARRQLGGEIYHQDKPFWQNVREHQHPFFQEPTAQWRLSLAPATPPLNLPGEWFLDWGGAQRWLKTDASVDEIRAAVTAVGGHATLFRNPDRIEETEAIFHPLALPLAALHRRIKKAFDPLMIFNRP
ncbi:MAG TPA: glycolate oxidase subunit GlcE [Gammaproteobacteria bacterium]|nr:glycolate oxidase subunit GlcE [Gammaproteobacteria bacterium]